MEPTNSGISNVIEGLFSRTVQERASAVDAVVDTPEVQAAMAKIADNDLAGFNYALLHAHSELVSGVLERELPGQHEAQFLFSHYEFVENNVEAIIRKHEGNACCADKARTIVHKLLVFLRGGSEVSFDFSEKYTFHFPTSVLNTHEEIYRYFNGLFHLYYGNSEPYLKSMLAIVMRRES